LRASEEVRFGEAPKPACEGLSAPRDGAKIPEFLVDDWADPVKLFVLR